MHESNGTVTYIHGKDEMAAIIERLKEMGETFQTIDRALNSFPQAHEAKFLENSNPMAPNKIKAAKLRKKKRKTGGPR